MTFPDSLMDSVRSFCMVEAVDKVPRGHMRVRTGFLYPDGASVDVFLINNQTGNHPHLSDLGQTMDFLLHNQIKPWTSKKRKIQLEDALQPADLPTF